MPNVVCIGGNIAMQRPFRLPPCVESADAKPEVKTEGERGGVELRPGMRSLAVRVKADSGQTSAPAPAQQS